VGHVFVLQIGAHLIGCPMAVTLDQPVGVVPDPELA
jgi:hypothetical protein